LGPITKGEHEAREQEADVGIPQNSIDHFDCLATDDGRVLEGIGQDKERDEEVALEYRQTSHVRMRREIVSTTRETQEGKPREDEIKCLVEEFDVDP
jgi:hypothetical protein